MDSKWLWISCFEMVRGQFLKRRRLWSIAGKADCHDFQPILADFPWLIGGPIALAFLIWCNPNGLKFLSGSTWRNLRFQRH